MRFGSGGGGIDPGLSGSNWDNVRTLSIDFRLSGESERPMVGSRHSVFSFAGGCEDGNGP